MTSKDHEIEIYKGPIPLLFKENPLQSKPSYVHTVHDEEKEDKSSIKVNHISIDVLDSLKEEYQERNKWSTSLNCFKRKNKKIDSPKVALIKSIWCIDKGEPQDRLWFLDIVRLIGSICLLTSSVISHTSQDWKLSNSLLYPVRSQWGFNIFLVLIGRAFVSKWIVPQKSKTEQDSSLSQSSVYKLGQSLLLRSFRFLLPIVVVQLLQRKVCESGPAFSNGFSYLFDQGYRDGWCTPNSNISLITRIISLFTENNSSQLVHQTGMLYQSPSLFQASLYALGVATLTSVFRNSSRTFLFIFLALVNWTTYTFLFPVMLGLLLADLQESKLAITRFSTKGFIVISFNAAIFGLLLFLPVIRENLSDGFDKLQTLYGIASKPNTTQGYHWMRFSDCLSAALLVFLAESLQPTKVGFCTKSLAFLGRHLSAALVVLHPLVIYGILPKIFNSAYVDVNGHNTILIFKLWASTTFITIALAIPFRFFIELGSMLAGRLFVAGFLPNNLS